jgi:hypothetical protein
MIYYVTSKYRQSMYYNKLVTKYEEREKERERHCDC